MNSHTLLPVSLPPPRGRAGGLDPGYVLTLQAGQRAYPFGPDGILCIYRVAWIKRSGSGAGA